MLTAIKGYYENGRIVMNEKAPVDSKTDVIITFLTDDDKKGIKRIPGGLKGKYPSPTILMSRWTT